MTMENCICMCLKNSSLDFSSFSIWADLVGAVGKIFAFGPQFDLWLCQNLYIGLSNLIFHLS